jgi:hypothetical protein
VRELGNEGSTSWSAAWESRGEVVFPQRARAIWWRIGIFCLLLFNSSFTFLGNLLDEDEYLLFTIASAIPVLSWTCLLGYSIWQLITRRPIIKIDHVGIQYGTGKRALIPWNRISSVGDPIGLWAFSVINVRAYSGKPHQRPVSPMNVKHLDQLAPWLRARLSEANSPDQPDRA